MLSISLTACNTITPSNNGLYAAPIRPKLEWVNGPDGWVMLSKEDAVRLAHYFIDIDTYVKKTGGN
jgi:hypothetical protein